MCCAIFRRIPELQGRFQAARPSHTPPFKGLKKHENTAPDERHAGDCVFPKNEGQKQTKDAADASDDATACVDILCEETHALVPLEWIFPNIEKGSRFLPFRDFVNVLFNYPHRMGNFY